MKRCIAILALAAGAACGGSGVTNPTEERRVESALGLHIEATKDFLKAGGIATPAHAETADRWWAQLMSDLAAAGFVGADPAKVPGYLRIMLSREVDSNGSILYSDGSTLVGGYYSRQASALYVPGGYPTASWSGRPNSQPLKHEYLHHWCWTVLKRDCMDGENHVFLSPNGVNIWNYTWDYGRHDYAAALAHP